MGQRQGLVIEAFEHGLEQCRHRFEQADAALAQQLQQGLRITHQRVADDLHAGAEQRRGEGLPHRNIEAGRRGLASGPRRERIWPI